MPSKPDRPNPYRDWVLLKDLRLGPRSQRVWLLGHPSTSDRVVMKSYDPESASQQRRFDKEIRVLRRLRNCPYVPKLLHVDTKRCTLWMTYCGKVAPRTEHVKQTVEKYLVEMAEKWHVYRIGRLDRRPQYSYRAIFSKNIGMTEDGKVWLFDYGSGSWRLGPEPAELGRKHKPVRP